MGKKNFVVTDRDLKALYQMFRFKTVTTTDLHESFGKVHYSAVTRRLRKLETLKLIRRSLTFDANKRASSLFALAPVGLNRLKTCGHPIVRNQIMSNYPEHDLRLVKLIKWLSGFKLIEKIITENELLSLTTHQEDESLKEFIDLRPDAVLLINLKGHTFKVALEYELHAKSQSRWKDKLLNYYMAGSIDAVLYFCESKTIATKICEIDREISSNRKSKVFHFTLSESYFDLTKIVLTNSAGEEFTLN